MQEVKKPLEGFTISPVVAKTGGLKFTRRTSDEPKAVVAKIPLAEIFWEVSQIPPQATHLLAA